MLKITKLHKTDRVSNGDREYIEATVGLRYLKGNADAYWSATCAIFEGGRDVGGGAAHSEIVRAFPHLAPFVALHLADTDGVPMYAKENGFYAYSGASRAYEVSRYGVEYADRHGSSRERVCRLLRIPDSLLPHGLDEAGFGKFVDSLRPYWLAQSQRALALLDTLPRF